MDSNLNLLDRLADIEVPAPPENFDRQLHGRLNRSLVVLHLADLFLHAMPLALLQLALGFIGLTKFLVLGRFDDERPRDKEVR